MLIKRGQRRSFSAVLLSSSLLSSRSKQTSRKDLLLIRYQIADQWNMSSDLVCSTLLLFASRPFIPVCSNLIYFYRVCFDLVCSVLLWCALLRPDYSRPHRNRLVEGLAYWSALIWFPLTWYVLLWSASRYIFPVCFDHHQISQQIVSRWSKSKFAGVKICYFFVDVFLTFFICYYHSVTLSNIKVGLQFFKWKFVTCFLAPSPLFLN